LPFEKLFQELFAILQVNKTARGKIARETKKNTSKQAKKINEMSLQKKPKK
jgi:hypothetical protein